MFKLSLLLFLYVSDAMAQTTRYMTPDGRQTGYSVQNNNEIKYYDMNARLKSIQTVKPDGTTTLRDPAGRTLSTSKTN